jgi:hypothetical protein
VGSDQKVPYKGNHVNGRTDTKHVHLIGSFMVYHDKSELYEVLPVV